MDAGGLSKESEFSGSAEIRKCIKDIENRRHASGGFCEMQGGLYRPESTAWAILALENAQVGAASIQAGREMLAASQFVDGRISFPGAPDAFWPTSLAVLALQREPQYAEVKERALKFLLNINGNHWKEEVRDPGEHDPSIRGWPWVAGAHSFVEPTAMTLLVLDSTKCESTSRFAEGIQMLLNRQLPHGGWNYGNTRVFGQELYPFVETTGISLAAMSGHVAEDKIQKSLTYLSAKVEECRTPLALAWSLFGLGAWDRLPGESRSWIEYTLKRQEQYGPYATSLLSLLALAFMCRGDFRKCSIARDHTCSE